MNTNLFEARDYITKAREALQRGDKETAWQLGNKAALLAPEMEDAWLVLTATDPNPRKALAHARRALDLHPESPRARRGWGWALARTQEKNPGNILVKQSTTLGLALHRQGIFARFPKDYQGRTMEVPESRTKRTNLLYPLLLLGAGFLVAVLTGLFVLARPVLASISSTITAPTEEVLWASVDIPKPAVTPLDVSHFDSDTEDTAASTPTEVPTLDAAEAPAAIPAATETPGTMTMKIVNDEPFDQSNPPDVAQAQYPSQDNGERWIDVNLSEQRVYAYEGDVIVNSFLASTGVGATPTVTGKYKIYVKVRIQDMSGPGYYLQDVPWVMFFYDEYGFHGTYWHNNFGAPMSRGCVNLTIADAEWLFNWAFVGTVVDIHY